MSFKNKTVIVTGGGSGIGAAITEQFAKELANVAIAGRNEARLTETAQKWAAFGNKILTIKADVSKEDDAKRIVQATIDKFGRLDVLVNNAAVSKHGSLCAGNVLEAYDQVMNTNLRAVIHLTTLATPYLIETKGNVINISSVCAVSTVGVPEIFTYNVSKAALDHFTRCAAIELAPKGVRVNTVSPGPVETDMLVNSDFPGDWDDFRQKTALDKVADKQEIADIVLFLASEKAKSVTGSTYVCDNGMLIKQ